MTMIDPKARAGRVRSIELLGRPDSELRFVRHCVQ